jgi:hypothetical protein
MHGGAKRLGRWRGERNGNYKYGLWTRETVEIRRTMRARIRWVKAYLVR